MAVQFWHLDGYAAGYLQSPEWKMMWWCKPEPRQRQVKCSAHIFSRFTLGGADCTWVGGCAPSSFLLTQIFGVEWWEVFGAWLAETGSCNRETASTVCLSNSHSFSICEFFLKLLLDQSGTESGWARVIIAEAPAGFEPARLVNVSK